MSTRLSAPTISAGLHAAAGWFPGRTRTVRGPTDRIVVVGAGLGGLSAAMRLAGAGREVTVLEREAVPGGRAGSIVTPTSRGNYRFDSGPTVLTMPELIADCFDALGEDMADWLHLKRLDPIYRARFADGSSIDVRSDLEQMTREIERFSGPGAAAGFGQYVEFLRRLYRYQMRDFIDRSLDTPLDLVTANLARLIAIGGFRRLAPTVAQYLADERLQRLYSFQALYAGLSPQQALALYAVISYMDSLAGVHFPVGGMHAVPVAMAAAAQRHGVLIRYGTEVSRVELRGDRAVAVHTVSGERIGCDAVVLNPDLPVAFRMLLGVVPRRLRRLRYSPSCFLLLAGSRARYPDHVHHTIHFGRAWDSVFRELQGGRLMSDPSLLVSRPTLTDPRLAPPDRESYYVLAPTPNLDAPIDWSRVRGQYRDHLLTTLEQRGYPGFDDAIEVEHTITPADWAAQGLERGTPFAVAHTFSQTGPFRPGNLWGENVVLTGSGTQPGVGVPMVLISGRLAAERITGPRPGYRSRAWP